ncbi:protein of unknown function [Candidatus Methylomirabilis oxygeniifera]|uniref:Uncharacterized protein n=1 Tax=Methylomirabilis oxygeniifera TaxID=671143 RepID=D5MI33_METO1|nr:protein of unknown function [Candidatus Methylomirabilis oxyfera]
MGFAYEFDDVIGGEIQDRYAGVLIFL